MPQFELDSEGTVTGLEYTDLSPFLQGYIEAMFFTENEPGMSMVDWTEDYEPRDGSFPGDAGFSDLDPDTLHKMHSDCTDFQAKARHLLSQAYAGDYDATQAGRDFWLTRNGHGCGFWDREQLGAMDFQNRGETLGEKLAEIAKGFGETWAGFYLTDDAPTGYGFVYLM